MDPPPAAPSDPDLPTWPAPGPDPASPGWQPPIVAPHLSSWVVPQAQPQPQPQASGWILPAPLPFQPAPGHVYVGFWRRFWAYLIDGFILGIPFWLLGAPFFFNGFLNDFVNIGFAPGAYVVDPATGAYQATAQTYAAMTALMNRALPEFDLLALGFAAIQVLYFGILWSRRGASIGQELLGIEVRHQADGSRISFRRGCLRVLGYFVSGVALYIGYIWVAFDSRKQGWHDKIASTVVVKPAGRRTKSAPRWMVALTIGALLVYVIGTAIFVSSVADHFPPLSAAGTPNSVPPVGAIWYAESANSGKFGPATSANPFPRGQNLPFVASLSRVIENDQVTIHTIFAGKDREVGSFTFQAADNVFHDELAGGALNASGQMIIAVEDSRGDVLAISTITLK